MEKKNVDLPSGHYIFIWGGLLKDAGGMTRVMLDRLCRFKRKGIRVTVLLGGRGKDQHEAVDVYQQAGYPEIQHEDFLCMEDWLADRLTIRGKEKTSEIDKEDFFVIVEEKVHYMYDDEGMLRQKKYYDDEGKLVKVEKYSRNSLAEKKIESIDFYYCDRLYKRASFINSKEKNESYFADNGFCFMTCQYYEGKEGLVKLFDQKNALVKEYKSISDVREFFYSEYVMEHYQQDMFVFCDPILDLEPGFRYMKESGEYKIYKIAINHGIGFAAPRNWNSRCNPRFQRYLEVPSTDLDAVVILTDIALENIKKRFGNINVFKCIPNKVDINPVRHAASMRNMRKTVCVGRFSPEKQFTQVVKAFAIVVKDHPDAILELYGRGNDESNIKEEIVKNNLENNVFIKGFSRNVWEVFSDARLSVVSSEYTFESFCLSLVESLACGCPVVSYEMKFGAAYVIENAHNGFLTEPNNIEKLAENISKIYNMDETEWEVCSVNAYETAKVFNEEKYEENWRSLLQNMVQEKSERTNIKDIIVEIQKIDYSVNADQISLKGVIHVEGLIPSGAKGRERVYSRNYTEDRNDYKSIVGSIEELGKNMYKFVVCIKNINSPISICFECTNSFLEKDVTDVVKNAFN